ncbi:GyrI-like domain-containing protein [Microbacteriaceae bacterium 4G12]
MNYRLVTKDEIKLIGIATRTTNEQEINGGKIPELWQRYFQEQIAEKTPNKIKNGNMLGLYTDYENGVSGLYTMLIGSEVSTFDEIPEGMAAQTIPAAKYIVFTTKKGLISEVVVQAWAYIWEWFQHSNYERTFTGDFEWYDERSIDPNQAEVDIYIAVK